MSLRPLWIAGRFLSRLPFPDPGPVEPKETGRSVPWYPVIGLLIGLLVALVAAGLAGLGVAADVAAALALMVWVWATGAIHLDGLADSADAWIGGLGDRERTLAIMKDPTSGPAAVTTLVLVLLAKWAGLKTLIAAGAPWLVLVVPLLGRAQLPLLLLTTPYARAQGMAGDQSRQLPRSTARSAVVLAAIAALLLAGWPGLALAAGALAVFVLGRRAMLRRIAGFTGDTAGALVELTETLLILLCVVLL
ncbi:adenosylcobinamide-GDP ribazoletransferase [Thiohalocapsa marina]|uniref:Adenosylcobinamide-GDP ribazoletransferase n=1 Tax=Thiohalocapsa marina TaxID=424902 RepID=A0A5M8FQ56_9GAMM|nr:adenosylcobinamide-GDP ribazoletransferase [Thiohalocapsa marina]KAA6186929.1 adenosylcobinamide-GDP ribazoletransferase [Thiohalocapsa marina]